MCQGLMKTHFGMSTLSPRVTWSAGPMAEVVCSLNLHLTVQSVVHVLQAEQRNTPKTWMRGKESIVNTISVCK